MYTAFSFIPLNLSPIITIVSLCKRRQAARILSTQKKVVENKVYEQVQDPMTREAYAKGAALAF